MTQKFCHVSLQDKLLKVVCLCVCVRAYMCVCLCVGGTSLFKDYVNRYLPMVVPEQCFIACERNID